MPLKRDIDVKTLEWLEWYSRSRKCMVAFAVDPDSERRTGVKRAVNGSVVPAHAVPAKRGTPKDFYCEMIVERIRKGELHEGRRKRK